MVDRPGVFLEALTWPEAKARFDADAVVVVPIGAAAKEHGPHLPLNTDHLVARALAEGVAAALPVVIAPIVGFGYYPAFVRYPGSQHLAAETFMALLDRPVRQADRGRRQAHRGDQHRRLDRSAAADRGAQHPGHDRRTRSRSPTSAASASPPNAPRARSSAAMPTRSRPR